MLTIHHAIHPDHFKRLTTDEIRKEFLLPEIFKRNAISLTYTHYDRYIVGGVHPIDNAITLPNPEILKATYFLERRELGIINVGGTGKISVDGEAYELETKEALYVPRGCKEIIFHPNKETLPLFYLNAAPAHVAYAIKKISLSEAETVEVGSVTTSNHRIIRKLIVNSVVQTCQLQMGLTDLQSGSVWNTMPAHTHDRRMEAYFYFNIPTGNTVCHFLGAPQETRHIWMQNHQAVLSPPWSIHSGAGTSNYSFIWGMAGENLDYSDMDIVQPTDLR